MGSEDLVHGSNAFVRHNGARDLPRPQLLQQLMDMREWFDKRIAVRPVQLSVLEKELFQKLLAERRGLRVVGIDLEDGGWEGKAGGDGGGDNGLRGGLNGRWENMGECDGEGVGD